MKIRTRLLLAFVILVGLGFYKLVDWVLKDLRPRYLEAMEESMVDIATILSSMPAGDGISDPLAFRPLRAAMSEAERRTFTARIYEVTKTNVNMRVYVTDRAGIVVYDSDNGRDEGANYSRWNDVALTLRGKYGARTTRRVPDDWRSAILCVGSPILQDGNIIGVLSVCKPAESVSLFVRAAHHSIVIGGVVAALAVMLFGIAVSFWITRPISRLTDYARAIRDGRRPPSPTLGRSELGELGAAFEEMRDALEGKQYIEGYVQSLTHEMKSPLSAIRGAAELLEEDVPPDRRARFLGNIRRETARMQDFVDRLLQLSALESRKTLRDVATVNLGDVVGECLQSLQLQIEEKEIAIERDESPGVTVQAETFLIRQSLVNLLKNALDFTPRKGRISIRVESSDGSARVTITDSGPGIPDYAVDRIFERFYSLRRPDTGEKSSGLGLTFVREAVELHGGSITLDNTGSGARATLTLPFTQRNGEASG